MSTTVTANLDEGQTTTATPVVNANTNPAELIFSSPAEAATTTATTTTVEPAKTQEPAATTPEKVEPAKEPAKEVVAPEVKKVNKENQSLRNRLRAAESQLEALTKAANIKEVLAEANLKEAAAEYLTGSTKEELLQSANKLKADLAAMFPGGTSPEATGNAVEQATSQPQTFTVPSNGVIAAGNGTKDLVGSKDYDAISKLLNANK